MAYITLNKKYFFYNLDIISKLTYSKDKIALVLKDNAYGHGLLEVAGMAKEYGITKAVVQHDSEAKEIEDFFDYILVLADIPQHASSKIRYTINDIKTIKKFPVGSLVELKVNTGMNRNGIEMDELEEALALINAQGLKLEAIFTHHASADELDGMYEMQKKAFTEVKNRAPKGLRFHSCNSAALFRNEKSCFDEDMVRVGIAAYGCLAVPPEISEIKLKPILSLYAQKIASRKIAKGQRVGYGGTFKAQEECVVSTYDFGYGDGFLRMCSHVHKTPEGVEIAGRISMDNSSFLSEKEELLIFNDAVVVEDYANTIAYEVLTSLKPYLKREIV